MHSVFGMTRDSGRKKQDRRRSSIKLPKGAYTLDKRLVPRVKEYLNQFRKGHQPDIEELVNHLQTRYNEYSRRKRRAFKQSVEKVCDAIIKEREEDDHLQHLEERFLQKRKNSPDLRNIIDDDDDEEQGNINDSPDGSSDSEFSLGDEPLMEVHDTNMMNQSMQSMYKATSSGQNSEDEGEHDQITDLSKANEMIQDTVVPGSKNMHGHEEKSSNEISTSADINQTMMKDIDLSSNKMTDVNGKRKRSPLKDERETGTTPKKSRRSLQRNGKEKPAKDPEFELTKSSVKFSDIGGCDDTVDQVCKLLVHMKHPEVFRTLGVTPPRGFLLHGPPGCGKTLLAHAIAGELEMPFIKLAATEIVSGVSGESEEKVRELFSRAVAHSPCVLFLDEIDSITPKRETASKDMERRIVSQLLTCMDDLNSNSDVQVMVIGATNRPDSLDPALRRAGRFDREISMGIPDENARERILRVLCQKLRLEENFCFSVLARLTPGFVGADLMSLAREAALIAVNRIFQELERNAESKREKSETTATTEQQKESDGLQDTRESSDTVPRSFSVTEWLKEQSPLTEDELEKLCINMDDFKTALSQVQPSAKREGFATIPGVTWEDVGALKDVREELTMAILAPVKYPGEFQALGLTQPPGILLAGPPGCGKTLLAKAIANESGINFISVKGPELLNMYVGESERAVRQVFQRARNSSPCVIFFDELDALCPRRSDSAESSVNVRVVNQLLTEMDGLEARKQVFIMGATNRPDIIDPAVLRPGRLDKVLYVGLPDTDDREDILRTLTKDGKKPLLLPDVSIRDLAQDERCESLSGADLAALVREACMVALRERIHVHSTGHESIENQPPPEQSPLGVGKRHFLAAFQKVKPSVSKKDQALYGKMRTLPTTGQLV